MMRGMRLPWLAVVVGLTACASAEKPGNKPDGGSNPGDDADIEPDDAKVWLDAPAPTPVTLSQTADTTVTAGASLACSSSGGFTLENSWYRVFNLAEHGITGPLHVTNVRFGVQEASPGQQVQLKIGTYAGTPGTSLSLVNVTPIQSATLNIAVETTNAVIDAPIDAIVPAGSNMIVEVFAPDHTGTMIYFFVGASTGAETKPGYLRTPGCGGVATTPTSMKSVNAAAGSVIMDVIGTH